MDTKYEISVHSRKNFLKEGKKSTGRSCEIYDEERKKYLQRSKHELLCTLDGFVDQNLVSVYELILLMVSSNKLLPWLPVAHDSCVDLQPLD